MTVFQVIILAVIEGLTEFLPVSSTGHLVLASKVLNLPGTEFLKTFEIVIQLGAILAVISISLKTVPLTGPVLSRIFLSFLPSIVFGFLFYGIIKSVFMESIPIILIALFAGGVIMILFEKFHRPSRPLTISDLTIKQALLIGLFQTLSLIPGVSRSAASIIGAMAVGLSRKEAVIYSFALAVPTMIAASALDLYSSAGILTGDGITMIAIGFLTAFISAYVMVNGFLKFVRTNTLVPFGIYRIILALVIYWLLLGRNRLA